MSLAPSGDAVLFGAGHRHFEASTQRAGTARGSARPVRDATFRARAPTVADGAPHDVVVVRRRAPGGRGFIVKRE